MHVFFLSLLIFSKLIFSKDSIRNSIIASNSLNPDQAQHIAHLILVQIVFKGYKQTTKVAASRHRVKTLIFSVFKVDEKILKNARLRTVSAVLMSNSPEPQITTVLLGELKVLHFQIFVVYLLVDFTFVFQNFCLPIHPYVVNYQ